MSLKEEALGLRSNNPDSVELICKLAQALIRLFDEVKEKTTSKSELDNLVLQFHDTIYAILQKLNDVGVSMAKMKIHKGMREITDKYAELSALVNPDATVMERYSFGSFVFERPISYRRILSITGITGVRRYEIKRAQANMGGRITRGQEYTYRTTDALQVAFNPTNPDNINQSRLLQGWIGTEDNLVRQNDAAHVIGRLWDYAEMHDCASEKADIRLDGYYKLSFVAQAFGKSSPTIISSSSSPTLHDLVVGSDADLVARNIRTNKAFIGREIMKQLKPK